MKRTIRRLLAGMAVVVGFLAITAVPAAAVEGGPAYVLYNQRSLDAMAVKGASKANGALAIQWPFVNNGVDNEIMIHEYVDYDANDWVRLKPQHTYTGDGNVHNDKCLAVLNASKALNASIIQYNCTYGDTNNDVWREQFVKVDGQIWYQYQNVHSNLCIVVKNASTANGAQLIQHNCNGGSNTLWNHGGW